MRPTVREVDTSQAEIGPRIAAMERSIDYPLGTDRFRIDHGTDYFAFFRRLGDLTYLVAQDGPHLLGVLAMVRCRFPAGAWYACDLKVQPGARGQLLGRRLAHTFAARHVTAHTRGYAISMNPALQPNRVVALLRRFQLGIEPGPQLLLFSLDAPAMHRVAPLLTRRHGRLSYLSLCGVKDIVLHSTGRPMDLLHAQFGPRADHHGARGEPSPGATHMFCMPESDALVAELRNLGIAPAADATVVHRGMPDQDWSFILTSDI